MPSPSHRMASLEQIATPAVSRESRTPTTQAPSYTPRSVPGVAKATPNSFLSPSSRQLFLECVNSTDDDDDESTMDVIDLQKPTFTAIKLPDSVLDVGLLIVADDIITGEKCFVDSGPMVEDELLMSNEPITMEILRRKILERPASSYVAALGTSHVRSNISTSQKVMNDYKEKQEEVTKVIEYQEKQIKSLKEEMKPDKEEFEKAQNAVNGIKKKIAELNKSLLQAEQKVDLLANVNMEKQQTLAAEEEVLSSAHLTCAAAIRIKDMAQATNEVLVFVANNQDATNGGNPALLPYADMRTPFDMALALGIKSRDYNTFKALGIKYNLLYGRIRLMIFFGYQHSPAFQLAYPKGLPKPTNQLNKSEIELIFCTMVGIIPPQSLIDNVEKIRQTKKRKSDDDNIGAHSNKKMRIDAKMRVEAYDELIKVSSIEDIQLAKMQPGNFFKNLFFIHEQRQSAAPGAFSAPTHGTGAASTNGSGAAFTCDAGAASANGASAST